MAEWSAHWTTSGAPAGDQQVSYNQSQNSTIQKVIAACNTFEGVGSGYLNGLAGTVTGANAVAINTGAALADGKAYLNDASVAVTVPSAVGGGNTRIDRIVLRCSWAAFTVRITLIAGTDAASPTAPAITQTSGTTYDIKLYQALVTTAGAVTLTDERTFAIGNFADVRQGGSSLNFANVGSTNYKLPANWKIQFGAVNGTIAGVTVTFPTAFTYIPIVFISTMSATLATANVSGLAATFFIAATSADNVPCAWMAIGPVA